MLSKYDLLIRGPTFSWLFLIRICGGKGLTVHIVTLRRWVTVFPIAFQGFAYIEMVNPNRISHSENVRFSRTQLVRNFPVPRFVREGIVFPKVLEPHDDTLI
jgi:ABC-type nitrate/sulfonate/bicarbonate transport system permease component